MPPCSMTPRDCLPENFITPGGSGAKPEPVAHASCTTSGAHVGLYLKVHAARCVCLCVSVCLCVFCALARPRKNEYSRLQIDAVPARLYVMP